jgi:hypothetical protein
MAPDETLKSRFQKVKFYYDNKNVDVMSKLSNRIRAGARFFVNFVKGREDTLRDNEYDSLCNLTATVESLGVLALQYNSLVFLHCGRRK